MSTTVMAGMIASGLLLWAALVAAAYRWQRERERMQSRRDMVESLRRMEEKL